MVALKKHIENVYMPPKVGLGKKNCHNKFIIHLSNTFPNTNEHEFSQGNKKYEKSGKRNNCFSHQTL